MGCSVEGNTVFA